MFERSLKKHFPSSLKGFCGFLRSSGALSSSATGAGSAPMAARVPPGEKSFGVEKKVQKKFYLSFSFFAFFNVFLC